MKYKVLIADDEPLARRSIRKFLKPFPDFEVAAECGDGAETVKAIRTCHPDLVFLDIQMPEMDGLEVIRSIGVENMPLTVFVTAYDQYALQAFDAQALDYLLKPFAEQRFRATLLRAGRSLELGTAHIPDSKLTQLLEQLIRQKEYLERIPVPYKGRFLFLKTQELDWIEAQGNYLRLHSNGASHLLRGNMNEMETRLDPAKFMRIHRSTIVNLERVKEVQPWFKGSHLVVMNNGQQLRLSRYQKEKLRVLIGKD